LGAGKNTHEAKPMTITIAGNAALVIIRQPAARIRRVQGLASNSRVMCKIPINFEIDGLNAEPNKCPSLDGRR